MPRQVKFPFGADQNLGHPPSLAEIFPVPRAPISIDKVSVDIISTP
jgi:hypothetical protein